MSLSSRPVPALLVLLVLAAAILLSPMLAVLLAVPLALALLALAGLRDLAEPEERVLRETHEIVSPGGSRNGIPPTTRPGSLRIPPPPD
jgi:hypothetical protein